MTNLIRTRYSAKFKKNREQRHHRQRRGSIVVMVGLAMSVLLGCCALAADYGRMVTTKNQLQRTCDASALAGAAELPALDSTITASATNFAQLTANQNGVNTAEIQVTFPTNNQIRVTATRQVNFLFAPILGLKTGTVNATALAGRTNLAGGAIVPLAITIDDYMKHGKGTTTFTSTSANLNTPFTGPSYGQSLTVNLIRNTKDDFTQGSVTGLDLSPGNSGVPIGEFERQINNGYNDAPVSLNSDADALRASENAQGGALVDGMETRLARAAQPPWNTPASSTDFPYTFPDIGGRQDNPRIMMILVGNPNQADNNQPQVYARALVPVWIESITDTGHDGATIKMRLLPEYTYSNDDPNVIVGDDSTPSTGVTVIRLLN